MLKDVGLELDTNGSSFVRDGKQVAGCAITSVDEIIKVKLCL